MDSLGPVSRKHQDWFDDNDGEIQGLLDEEHQKHKAHLSDISLASSKVNNETHEVIQLDPHRAPNTKRKVRLPIQTYVRQSRLGSEACKTPS